jgi:hypothetical protein
MLTMPQPKALTRTPPASREEQEVAAVVLAGEPHQGVSRMTITLTADAMSRLEERLFALSRNGLKVSTSAYLEAHGLEGCDLPVEADAEVLRRRGASQRRRT